MSDPDVKPRPGFSEALGARIGAELEETAGHRVARGAEEILLMRGRIPYLAPRKRDVH